MGDFMVGDAQIRISVHEQHNEQIHQHEEPQYVNRQADHEQIIRQHGLQEQENQQWRHSVNVHHPEMETVDVNQIRLSVRQNMPPEIGNFVLPNINQQAAANDDLEMQARRNKTEHGMRLYNMTDYAMRRVGGKSAYKLSTSISDATLGAGFKKRFNDRLNAEERAKKQKNPKSRLYQKKQNADILAESISKYETKTYDEINKVITRQALRCDKEDYHDLAAFMQEGEEEKNRELINLYLGKSVRVQGEALEGQDVRLALDTMAASLFSIDISTLDFTDDKSLVQNASILEKISSQVAAFDRMSEKHHYAESLNEEDVKRLNERLDALRSISAYYSNRKEIITNDLYKTHYDDELSMESSATDTEEQRVLGEKLVASLILGRTMMRLNGIKVGKKTFGENLRFTSEQERERFEDFRENYESRDMHQVLSDEAYVKKDVVAEKEFLRLTSRIRELNAINPVVEQQQIHEDMHAVLDQAFVPVQRPENRIGGWAKFKNRVKLGIRWFSALSVGALVGIAVGLFSAPEKILMEGRRKAKAQDKRRHDMVPGREGEFFRDEVIRKDEKGEDIDVYSDVRRGPLVWEKMTAGDPESPPEVMIMVEQGKRGSNVSMSGEEMGHAMICLSYSRYSKITRRKERYKLTMGFYPGSGITNGTTVSMLDGAIIGAKLDNDRKHAYDVARRYQVKPGDINKILRKAETYADKGYGYYKRNCTTFVVDMAKEIGLPVANEFKEEEMVFEGANSIYAELGRPAAGMGFDILGANSISSRMNKKDLSYQNFGQKMYTKEDLKRFYDTAGNADMVPKGYTPGHVGETLRYAGTGEVSAYYDELKTMDTAKLGNAVLKAGIALWNKIKELIPANQMGQEEQKLNLILMFTEDSGINKLLAKEGGFTTQEVRDLHKSVRDAMKTVSRYYDKKLLAFPEASDLVMRFMSLCETTLGFADDMYIMALKKEVKGDAGLLRYDFANTDVDLQYTDENNVSYTAKIKPGVYEGYLMAGKTPEQIVKEVGRINELNAIGYINLPEKQQKELDRLRLTENFAKNFTNANRYLLEKEDITEKDVKYAFHDLPQMEQDTKGKGKVSKQFLNNQAPSNIYKSVIFEKLFGGIRQLELHQTEDHNEWFQKVDNYMSQRMRENPKLFGMIVKHWTADRNASTNDLSEDFLAMLGKRCLTPAYAGTKLDENKVSSIVYLMIIENSQTKQLVQTEIEKYRNNQQGN